MSNQSQFIRQTVAVLMVCGQQLQGSSSIPVPKEAVSPSNSPRPWQNLSHLALCRA